MAFKVEKTVNGKPCIILDKYKFRLERTTANGDVSWRCLAKDCKASIITDANQTELIERRKGHSGKHPVTLRSLSSTPATPPTPRSRRNTPLLTPLVKTITPVKPLTSEKSTETDYICLKSLDDLVARAKELTQQRDCFIDILQRLTIQIDTCLENTYHSLKINQDNKTNNSMDVEQKLNKLISIYENKISEMEKLCVSTTKGSTKTPHNLVNENDKLHSPTSDVQSKTHYAESYTEVPCSKASSLKLKKHTVHQVVDHTSKNASIFRTQNSNNIKRKNIKLSKYNKNSVQEDQSCSASATTNSLKPKRHKLSDLEISSWCDRFLNVPSNVLVIDPSVSHLIGATKEPTLASQVCLDVGMKHYEVVMMTVNSRTTEEQDCGGDDGSHWSLLIHHRSSGHFFHLDSFAGLNSGTATLLAERLLNCDTDDCVGAELVLKNIPCLQQRGATECGAHVIHNMELA